MTDDIHPTPLAQFTTTGECQVTLSRYDDGSVLAYFQVEHGDIATALLDADKNIVVQRASVQFDPAALASLREAITEHRWQTIEAERTNEITLTCTCGLVWKHLPLKRGQHATIPACPAESQPSPETKLVRLLEALPLTGDDNFRYAAISYIGEGNEKPSIYTIREAHDGLRIGDELMPFPLLDEATVRKIRDALSAWLEVE